MKHVRAKGSIKIAGGVMLSLLVTGMLSVSAGSLHSASGPTGGWLASTIITIVNLFIKLVLTSA